MAVSPMRLIKNVMEFVPKADASHVPHKTRGIYVLYQHTPGSEDFEVVYIGMARGANSGIRSRLKSHKQSKIKAEQWTHFSAFEVWDNIAEQEVAELEGIFRHVYRHDPQANRLNTQRAYKPLKRVCRESDTAWKQ